MKNYKITSTAINQIKTFYFTGKNISVYSASGDFDLILKKGGGVVFIFEDVIGGAYVKDIEFDTVEFMFKEVGCVVEFAYTVNGNAGVDSRQLTRNDNRIKYLNTLFSWTSVTTNQVTIPANALRRALTISSLKQVTSGQYVSAAKLLLKDKNLVLIDSFDIAGFAGNADPQQIFFKGEYTNDALKLEFVPLTVSGAAGLPTLSIQATEEVYA